MRTAANLGWHQTLLRLLVLFLFWPSCPSRAALVNRIIDDSFGDSATGFKPIYNPSGSWADQTCSSCPIQPDRSQAYDGTWTAATYTPQMQNLSITLQFTGTTISVYFILPNANEHGTAITTNTFVDFTMDGRFICNFTHNPDMSTYNMIYNAPVFTMIEMSNTPHQLIISTDNVPYNAYINFDYAVYTIDTADSSTTVPSSSALSPSSFSVPIYSTLNPSSSVPIYSTLNPSSSISGGNPPSSTSNTSTSGNQQGNLPQGNVPGNQSNSQTNSSSSSSHLSLSPRMTAIVGGVLGAFAIIIIACLLFLLLKKSKKSTTIKPTTLGSPSRATSQLHSNDNETGSHLPWQNDVFSETTEPFGNLPVGLASGVATGTTSGSPTLTQSHSRSVSDYTSAPTPTPALLPIGRAGPGDHTPFSSDRDKVRAIRQTEIEEQLNSAQREMENLRVRQSMPPPPNAAERPAPTDQEMEALREQVRMLSDQIEHLHRERQSDLALGLSDEAPPAYA